MKKTLVILVTGTLLAGPMVGEAKAGDREWAIAGKVLAGLLVLDAVAEPCHHAPVVYAPPVVYRQPVVYRRPIIYPRPVCRPIVLPRRPICHPRVPGRPLYHSTYRASHHGGWRR